MSIWSMKGLTFLKMNSQHLFKGIADPFFTYFQLLADTNINDIMEDGACRTGWRCHCFNRFNDCAGITWVYTFATNSKEMSGYFYLIIDSGFALLWNLILLPECIRGTKSMPPYSIFTTRTHFNRDIFSAIFIKTH